MEKGRRITRSQYYHGNFGCPFEVDCEAHYCQKHRLLWNFCETMRAGVDDTYANGRPHYVWEAGDCPWCEAEARLRKLETPRCFS